MNTTLTTNVNYLDKKWYVIDATDKSLGRLASQVSQLLMGKQKVIYSPAHDNGDYVIIINAEHFSISGKKETQKIYRNHSGRPGGMKTITLRNLKLKNPERILEQAIKGMLPKNKLGNKMFRNLKVYTGNNHPHQAQKPIII